ncbi:Sulfotransferase family protein [Aliiroseovarius sediminilitoris]|uniref:Sulfotransferase family protein n=2 Tax=Aliiroseovarius sediminilitoris TaxID=1173584 RepID=A0A1I0QWH5_9RHOB|nr:Sulfotransferase family protein [Aliiroseovarius sediminilitoris]
MKMVLYELEHGKQWSGDPDHVHPQFPTYPIREDDFKATEGFWRYAIIRDPISRLLSAYGNRVHHHHDIRKNAAPRRFEQLLFHLRHPGLSLYPDRDSFFCKLERYQTLSYSIWHHTAPISTFIGNDLDRFDAIFRLEDIPLLEEQLSSLVGRRIILPREQTEGEKVEFDMLSPTAQAAILSHTRTDYELLKDYYQAPIQS